MADILNLQVKDETLNNIISNNPYYVDIKGSVNICLIRCGQEIDKCNSVNFSTMTNYGKILVLTPDKSKPSKCNIKLAFDNTNDTIDDKGDGNYIFEKAFFTVPSLHKLNGQIFDMETFLLFSSIQKNGTILYVCLCTFNNGATIVKNDDPKLLNFKLLNELFSKNNTVPDMYGTNQINGIPNPVDISNFIPEEGSRNFYDYTHPGNTKVNFRIFQTPMFVSNDIITILKNKLTPGNIYTNFKDYIGKSINPNEGLFFYFSEDLTNRYKSFQSNNIESTRKQPDNFENISESILEEQELFEKESKFKKLEIKKNTIFDEETETDDLEIDDIKKAESFSSKKINESNNSITIIIFIISFMLIDNFLNIIFINNFFTPSKNIDQSDLPNCLSEISLPNMKTILSTKFKYYSVLLWQSIITILIIILLIVYMSNNSIEQSIYPSILIFLILIFITGISVCILNIKYFIYRLKSIYDDDFSQKENYLFNYIITKTYKNNTLKNLWNIMKEDYLSIVKTNNQPVIQYGGVGGDEPNEIDTSILVPGQKSNSLQKQKDIDALDNIKFFNCYELFKPEILSIIYIKFDNNKSWKTNCYILISVIILFFIIGILFQLKYISTGNNSFLTFIVSSIIISFLYFPIAVSIISFGYLSAINNKLQIAVNAFTLIGIFIAFFIPIEFIPIEIIKDKANWLNNIPFWLCISSFVISILLLIVGKFSRNNIFGSPNEKGGVGKSVFGKLPDENNLKNNNVEPSAPILHEYELLKVKLEESDNKRILYQQELEKLYSMDDTKNSEIKKLQKQLDDKSYESNNDDYTQKLENNYLLLKEILNEKKEKELLFKSRINSPQTIDGNSINNLKSKISELESELNSTSSSFQKLKAISNEQKEKELFLKDYIDDIDDLKSNINKLIKSAKISKLGTFITSLLFIAELINKLTDLNKESSSIDRNKRILEILNKLSSVNINYLEEELMNDIKSLPIENTVNYDRIKTQLTTIISNIKNIIGSFKSLNNVVPDKSAFFKCT